MHTTQRFVPAAQSTLFHHGRTQMQKSCVISVIALAVACINSPAQGQPFDAAPRQLTVMTWNVEWMFDHRTGDNESKLAREQSAPSAEYWESKLVGVSNVIAEARPDIVAFQEIEGDQTLAAIVQKLNDLHRLRYRYAFIQGTDRFTEQDVGLIFQSGLVNYRRYEQSKSMFDSKEFYNLSKHLVGEFRWGTVVSPLTILNMHLRATEEAEEPRVKQAKLAKHWMSPLVANGEDVLIVGDANSEHSAGSIAGDVLEIVGRPGEPPMIDLLARLPDPNQPTHLILSKQFDRIYCSPSMVEDGPGLDWVFASIEVLDRSVVRGKRDGHEHWDNRLIGDFNELDLSDHFPVVAKFRLQ